MLLSRNNPQTFEAGLNHLISNIPQEEIDELKSLAERVAFDNNRILVVAKKGKKVPLFAMTLLDAAKPESGIYAVEAGAEGVYIKYTPPVEFLEIAGNNYSHAQEALHEIVAYAISRSTGIRVSYGT